MVAITIITETNEIIPHLVDEDNKMEAIYLLLKCRLVKMVHAYNGATTYMLVDEEGLLKRNPQQNQLASMLTGTPICGHVCIIQHKDFK